MKFFDWFKAPVKSLGKKLLCWGVQKEGDKFQIKLNDILVTHGKTKFNAFVDEWQKRLGQLVAEARFLPEFLKQAASKVIQDEVDKFQKIANVLGPGALNAAFDQAQAKIIERIQAIN